jgi:hypothetical protein
MLNAELGILNQEGTRDIYLGSGGDRRPERHLRSSIIIKRDLQKSSGGASPQ